MLHLGDITKINGLTAPIVDCIIGGSPCQDLSVAGRRAGLDGERSGLFMEQVRIAKEMRKADVHNGRSGVDVRPRYMVWENVPGAFSSNGGEDFRVVLEELARVVEEGVTIPRPAKGKWATTGVIIGDGWSLAWRVFDAQYWGVPQRRRRICIVVDFNGHTAPQIVFSEGEHHGSTERGDRKPSVGYIGEEPRPEIQSVCEGLSRHLEQSQPQREDPSPNASGSLGAGDCEGITFEPGIASREGGHIYEGVSGTLRAKAGDNQMSVAYKDGNYIDVEMEVATRRYEVDTKALCECLRTHKDSVGLNNKAIAEALDVPLTKVEHWFRQDKCFAIPDPEIWYEIKSLLNIQTDEFDKGITEFEYKGGNYDMRNRIHTCEVAPTLACGCGNNLYLLPDGVVAYTDRDLAKPCSWDGGQTSPTLTARNASGCQRMPDKDNFNAILQPIAFQGNAGADASLCIGEDVCSSLVRKKECMVAYPIQPIAIDMGGGKSSVDIHTDRSPTLTTTHYGEPAVVYDARGNGDGTVAPTMTGDHQNRVTDYTGVVVTYSKSKRAQSATDNETWVESDKTNTLNAFDVGDVRTTECVVALDRASFNVAKGPSAVCYVDTSHADDVVRVDDMCAALQARDYKGGKNICVAVDAKNCTENDINGSLQSNSAHSLNGNNVVRVKYIVRRLTPLECERLQGFPDRWTDIGEYIDTKGKKCKTSDASRYKALGNSIALPSWKWVLKRLCSHYERDATMCSLFSGIGGFDLLWTQINGPDSVKFCSEIEEFPIAVTKARIGE
jgi:site-specific DNA-cytosine methylase